MKPQSSSSSITKNNYKNCVVFLSLLLHIDNYSICTAWMWPMKYYMYVFRWEEALWNGGSGGGSGPVSLLHRSDLPQCREKCLCKMFVFVIRLWFAQIDYLNRNKDSFFFIYDNISPILIHRTYIIIPSLQIKLEKNLFYRYKNVLGWMGSLPNA